MRRFVSALLLAVSASAFGQATAPTTRPDRGLVLDENGYFRIHYEFGLMRISSDALKSEGQALLGDEVLKRLEQETKRHLKDREIDFKQTDWRDVACVHFVRTQLGDDRRAVEMIQTVPAPAGWTGLDFDDSSWMRQRIGRLYRSRYHGEAYDFSNHLVRAAHLRSYFEVPEEALRQVKSLRLDLSYRGGARVFVNGTEVARGNLAEGELAPSAAAAAEDYPRQAYVILPDEGPPPRGGTFGDIRCPFDEAPKPENLREPWKDQQMRVNASHQAVNRTGWDRLMRLRDRRLTGIEIPARLLRPGRNVLAIEIRGARFHPQIYPGAGGPQAENWSVHGGTENFSWDHCRLLWLQLRSDGTDLPMCLARPPGVQVWAEDMHTRLFSPDFNPPGAPAGTVRIVGAPNGTFSGQVVVGTDRELSGLAARLGDLKGPDGMTIPAAAAQVMCLKGHSITELYKLGWDRCLGLYHWTAPMAVVALARYEVGLKDPPGDPEARKQAEQKMLSDFRFFDHVAAAPPEKVPAGTCQPIWLSLKVPPEAAPGTYRGGLTVHADGVAPMTMPVEVEVIPWRVPNPLEFQTIVESEQSPYGVAKAYGIPRADLWSDEHFRLMEVSFRQLARLGADWVFVPVLANSEFGNRDDCSLVRWTRTKDGGWKFDYAILDRYLDLAVKHLGRPRVICFQIMHGCPSASSAVKVFDEATGKQEMLDVGPKATETRRPIWRAFATSLVEHMRRRGLEDSTYWGHAFDVITDQGLVQMMEEFAPQIRWAAGAHGRKPDRTFQAVARAYGSDITDRSLMGWKNPFIHLVMPRTNGSVMCVEGTSTPFTYRALCDRAIYGGFNGVGRMGGDYFDQAWFDGFSGGQYLLVGRSCVHTLWPGPAGAESSARNEAMLEGVQEAEARIFLEQALDRKLLPDDLAAEVQQVLDDHFRGTLHIPGGSAAITMMEYTGDWQGRSRRLFSTAGRVGALVGVDVDRTEIGSESVTVVSYGEVRTGHGRDGVALPALGKAEVSARLRNWTGKPRAWTAATTQPWIKPGKTGGELQGQENLPITLDGAGLSAGKTLTGTLTVTDVQSGRTQPVEITVRVEKPFEFTVERTVFNVTVGQTETRDYLLVNRTAARQPWKVESSVPWMKVAPAEGALEPGESVFVKVAAEPTDKAAAVHASSLTLTAAGAAVKEQVAFKTFVIPLYQAPAKRPDGAPVALEEVSRRLLVRHRSLNWFDVKKTYDAPTFGPTLNVWHGQQPLVMGEKKYATGMWILPRHETVYRIEGEGFTGFSAEVGWNAMVARNEYGAAHHTMRMNFEVHVDGQVRAQSGLMKATDPPRLLVVEGLAGAKEIRLVSRTDFDADDALGIAYCNWAEPKFHR